MNEYIHIGKIISGKLKEDNRSISWLAGKLHYERTNAYKLLKKPCMDTSLLLRISIVLKHDFFSYYSDFYNNNK